MLARLGAKVAVTGRREEELAETAALAAAAGYEHPILPVSCDVREPENVDAMLDEVLAKLDEGLATTSNLLANKYIKPIRAEA